MSLCNTEKPFAAESEATAFILSSCLDSVSMIYPREPDVPLSVSDLECRRCEAAEFWRDSRVMAGKPASLRPQISLRQVDSFHNVRQA
jgi:hypothetical protein